ncbi:MAG: SHOCT domain-containing protein [Chloroflexota bacterium]
MDSTTIKKLAEQHGFSEGAVMEVATAMQRGNGRMAQFNHPELGGSGQWMAGGMMMIGDMFNNALKARVQSLCDALAGEVSITPLQQMKMNPLQQWWPEELGLPTTAGSQNNSHYAYFAMKDRLAIKRGGKLYLYNTSGHVIIGAAQQQADHTKTLTFQTHSGSMSETDFELIEMQSAKD